MATKSAGIAAVPEGQVILSAEQADALRHMGERADATSSAIAAAIQAWFVTHIHNSSVARSVDAINHLSASLAHLEAAIVAAVKKEI
jgi:hypothetical protein